MTHRWTLFGLRKLVESSSRGQSRARAAAKPGAGYALTPGTQRQEFVIERVLGAGGFALTYLARDESLDAWRAVKEYLPREWAVRRDGAVTPRTEQDAENYRWGLDRFLKEARILARFEQHRDIVSVYRVFEGLGTAYLVMEYVDGRSLKDVIASLGVLPDDAVRALLLSLTHGLAEVHGAGLLHRDIKPDNVMLRPNGMPVLIDFGSARQVTRGSRPLTEILTPGYAPIEQYSERGNQGPWTDIYALGAVAYVALSGKLPDTAPDRVRGDRLPPVADAARRRVHAGLAAAIDAALSVDEGDRPQTVFEWRAMLEDRPAGPRSRYRPALEWKDAFGSQGGGPDVSPRAVAYSVGRGTGCHVWLSHSSVSRHHADVERLPDGRLQVTDLKSTNGTWVLVDREWQPVRQCCLRPADHIRFGEHEMAASELEALCVEKEAGSTRYRHSTVEADMPRRRSGPPTREEPDSKKGLARDVRTGELVEKERAGE